MQQGVASAALAPVRHDGGNVMRLGRAIVVGTTVGKLVWAGCVSGKEDQAIPTKNRCSQRTSPPIKRRTTSWRQGNAARRTITRDFYGFVAWENGQGPSRQGGGSFARGSGRRGSTRRSSSEPAPRQGVMTLFAADGIWFGELARRARQAPVAGGRQRRGPMGTGWAQICQDPFSRNIL